MHATGILHPSEAPVKERTDRLTRSRAVSAALFEHDRVSLSVRSFTGADFEATQQSQMISIPAIMEIPQRHRDPCWLSRRAESSFRSRMLWPKEAVQSTLT